MDLVAIVLFLGMYYLKPQEWFAAFDIFHPAQLTMFMGISGLYNREKGLRGKDLFRTPHDVAMILFFAWLVLTSGNIIDTFRAVMSLIVFYLVIVQTLNSVRRMEIFLIWWCIFVLVVSALAVSSEYGFDPFGSYPITHWWMKNRLVLNLSIFNNPNALAHSVVPVIPMLYFLMLWKRPLLVKKFALICMALPLYCIYLTVSKGAFLSGFATLLTTLTFGRPKAVQITIAGLAIGIGMGALYTLPRMTELNNSKADEAIQGRVAAYTYGYQCVTTLWAGIGYGNWMDSFYKQSRRLKWVKEPRLVNGQRILIRKQVPERYAKAAHGSFNNMGAELGFTGLALFFGMVWCSLRTLITAKTGNIEEERVRRILFVLMISYLVSSWMVDFGYRATFFMFTAATAAFHRHLMGIHRQQEEEMALEAVQKLPIWKRRQTLPVNRPKPAIASLGGRSVPAPVLEPVGSASAQGISAIVPVQAIANPVPAAPFPAPGSLRRFQPTPTVRSTPANPLEKWVKAKSEWKPSASSQEELPPIATIIWNKISMVDIAGAWVLTYACVRFWGYIIHTM